MNLYFLVEGRRTEKYIYRSWVKHAFPHLSEVDSVESLSMNNFYILAGYGYPAYRSRIENALTDIQQYGCVDQFFICVDAEENTIEDKKREIEDIIQRGPVFHNSHVVVADCCIETWLLGHAKMLKNIPERNLLRQYKTYYDVSALDPELMPCIGLCTTKAQFHYEYLREVFSERGLAYSKRDPGVVCEKPYLDSLISRYRATNHIKSFGHLYMLWISLGAVL